MLKGLLSDSEVGYPEYHLVLPGPVQPVAYAALADSARHLVDSAHFHSKGRLRKPLGLLWCHAPSRKLWRMEDLAPVSLPLVGSSPEVFLAAGCALLDDPPLERLSSRAAGDGFAWCGRRSCRDVYAFACHPAAEDAHRTEIFWSLMTCLTGTIDEQASADVAWTRIAGLRALPTGAGSVECSTALIDLAYIWSTRPFDSPFYLNSALAEMIARPRDRAPVAGDPARMAQALLAQRDGSRVPWIFNSLLNEIEFREGVVVPESFPPEVHLSTTGACNIECHFCTYAHKDVRRGLVSPEDVAKMDFLRHAQTLRLHSGLGEPTTNKHLPDILTSVTDAHPHLGINFFTNAVSLGRPALLEALVGRAHWINVSLNAANRESWQTVCGSDHFERVRGGLGALLAAKRANRSLRPLVFASIVLTAANIEDLPRMPALCRELGIDRLTGFPYSALGYQGRFGPEMALEACRDRYDELYPETVAAARKHGVSLEIPAVSEEIRASFGTEVRPLHDFARIETNAWSLGRFVSNLHYRKPPGSFCEYLWRLAPIGSTSKIHRAQEESHYMYPCIGPLSSLDLSRRAAFRFPDAEGFQALRRNEFFTRLREAQHQTGLVPPCDVCRCSDTRDPQHFPMLERVVGEFALANC